MCILSHSWEIKSWMCQISVTSNIIHRHFNFKTLLQDNSLRLQAKTGSLWARRQTSTRCTSKPDPTNLHQVEGWWAAFTGVETRLWPSVDHLDPPDLPRHGCNSDRGPAASGGPTFLANDRNGGRLRLNASRHDDDDDDARRWNEFYIRTMYLISVFLHLLLPHLHQFLLTCL